MCSSDLVDEDVVRRFQGRRAFEAVGFLVGRNGRREKTGRFADVLTVFSGVVEGGEAVVGGVVNLGLVKGLLLEKGGNGVVFVGVGETLIGVNPPVVLVGVIGGDTASPSSLSLE